MEKLPRFLPRLRRRQALEYLIIFLLLSYCITLLTRIKCIEGYRNLRKRISRNIFNTPDDVSCYHRHDNHADGVKFIKKNAIYMISASCDSSLSMHRTCAIESVLTSHSYNKHVYVLLSKPVKDCLCDEGIIRGLVEQPLLKFISIQIDKFVEDTPLKNVFRGDFLKTGVRQEARVAEYLKFAALYKFGGVVIDLDLILAKPVWYLGLNWSGRMNGSQLGSAAFALDKNSQIGKSLLVRTMKLLTKQRHQQEVDGGLALTEAFRQLCYKDPVTGCSHFSIHEVDFFYPYNKSSNYMFFRRGETPSKPYGYYVWDRTEGSPARGSVYARLMTEFCPKVAANYGVAH